MTRMIQLKPIVTDVGPHRLDEPVGGRAVGPWGVEFRVAFLVGFAIVEIGTAGIHDSAHRCRRPKASRSTWFMPIR